jgi:3-phenylpropionate/trans-cinnamate dioxygenase ferredoxin subunit
MSTVAIGTFDELVDGEGRRIDVDGSSIAVFRVGDDVHALADRCSHAEASLSEGEVFGDEVECPRHGASFDLVTGRALSLPATKPVRTYRTEVRDGEVFVEIGEGGSDD